MWWGKRASALTIRTYSIAIALVLTVVAGGATASFADDSTPARENCGRGWIYFDLGNTLVDTSDWDHLKYMPHALEYVRELKTLGFRLGLITNVPESWGATQEAKLATLKQEIAKTWIEPEGFVWDQFEHILLPPTDQDRKPKPYLFAQARTLHPGCKIAYEGEDASEVTAAQGAGFDWSYVVGSDQASGFYPAPDRIFQDHWQDRWQDR